MWAVASAGVSSDYNAVCHPGMFPMERASILSPTRARGVPLESEVRWPPPNTVGPVHFPD